MSIKLSNVSKKIGESANYVLSNISLEINDGEFVSLTGRSGSGKSTLLYILSSLDNPTEGSVEISNRAVASMSGEELHQFRNLKMGFVFQFHYLIAELTTLQNVLMPARKSHAEAASREYAEFLLNEFGLHDKLQRYPRQLSGGEQQRVAIARALVMRPKYLFADEPTGSLDTANSETVIKIFERINRENGTTIVMVTHDPDFAARARRQIHLRDGQIQRPV